MLQGFPDLLYQRVELRVILRLRKNFGRIRGVADLAILFEMPATSSPRHSF